MNFLSLVGRIAYVMRGGFYRAAIIMSGGRCGPSLRVERGFRLRHGGHRGLSIGKSVYLGAGTVIDCPYPGTLSIGDNVTLTHGVFISAAKSVTIGKDTLIGEYVSIRDANHQIDISPVPIRQQPMLAQGCEIGSDVWIGRGCAILAGSQLQDGCVVGANSVVKGDVPRNAIVAGSPAKIIRYRIKTPEPTNEK
ncbi:MAG: acyltransferase [Mesorhizobium sp.]|nr:acyltransferase [Mesorhizobium sp.]